MALWKSTGWLLGNFGLGLTVTKRDLRPLGNPTQTLLSSCGPKSPSFSQPESQSLAFLLAVLTSLEEPRPRPTLRPSQSSALVNTHVSGSTQSAQEATEHQPKGEVNWLLGAVISRQPRPHRQPSGSELKRRGECLWGRGHYDSKEGIKT